MTIKELNEIIAGYSDDSLRLILKELYKAVPKAQREENKIDELIKNPEDWKKPKKAYAKIPGVKELAIQIDTFVDRAYNGLYIRPNGSVNKKNRSQWRLPVISFVKALQAHAGVTGEDRKTAADAALSLYELMWTARYEAKLFASDEPFEAINFSNVAFFGLVLSLMRGSMPWSDYIREGLELLLMNTMASADRRMSLIQEFVYTINNTELSEITISIGTEMLRKLKKPERQTGRRIIISEVSPYETLVKIIFGCFCMLHEYERGIDFLKEELSYYDEELITHHVLGALIGVRSFDLFMREYEAAVESGITVDRALENYYDHLSSI
ncbi:MAG: hypothetical protein LAT75_07105 [Candidatus Cyclonatronum sp.]|uniref:hypothetical protein n=1 Tax=Cyclonatronum sp. TaxID=3024185 RepID=UPI0025C4C2B6|nr:hypothetical protein [Cyclonatronum sp.]MCH8486616.1 hypothetical protein [Cyclonatronum sp.]